MQRFWHNLAQQYLLVPRFQLTSRLRWFHVQDKYHFDGEERYFQKDKSKSQRPNAESQTPGHLYSLNLQEPSLFEELFPEEIANRKFNEAKGESAGLNVPRLSLPISNQEDGLQIEHQIESRIHVGETSTTASKDAYRQWSLTVLVVRRASKSLDESDFRRIAPEGHHIEDWKGPGDFLKGFTSFITAHQCLKILIYYHSDSCS